MAKINLSTVYAFLILLLIADIFAGIVAKHFLASVVIFVILTQTGVIKIGEK